MKSINPALLAIGALSAIASGCVAAPQTPAPAAPTPPAAQQTAAASVPAAPRTPTPQPPRRYENYLDAPQTPGDWRYSLSADERSSAASFGEEGGASVMVIGCEKRAAQIHLLRRVEAPSRRAARIETETAVRLGTAEPALARSVRLSFDAQDPILDAMAFSKGRFAVEIEGEETLYLPSWTEVSRVIEDCRANPAMPDTRE